MRIGHADLRVGPVAGLARELERDHAGDVALQREHLQIEHQPRVIGVRGRHAGRTIEIRQRDCRASRLPPSECVARPRARCRDTGRRARDPPGRAVFCSRVMSSRTQSSRLACASQRRPAVGRAATLAEQPLEDDPRMRFGRQRRRRRRPRQVVLIDARVAVVALADRLEQVHRQLERRQQRLLSDLLAPRSDRPWCRGSSRCSRSTSPSPRSETRRSRWRACRDTRSSARGCVMTVS